MYRDNPATPASILQSINRLKVAFPRMDDSFFNMLSERIVANGFSEDRLTDAVNSLIDNFSYKELNISDIIRYDRKVKLYSYREVCNLVDKGYSMNDFELRDVGGKIFRVLKSDLV